MIRIARYPMLRIALFGFSVFAVSIIARGAEPTSTDWPTWRGPNHDGIASSDQSPPTTWNETENIRWKAKIPGRGHGSPTVLGDRVFIQTADPSQDAQFVLCFQRSTGDLQWSREVHRGGMKVQGRQPNAKATFASSTIATDGQRLYANFYTAGAVHTSALTLAGEIVWQQKVTDYTIHQGFGTSPAIHKDLVIVSADNKGGGAVVAMDRETGKVIWRHDRPKKPNYASPIIIRADEKTQLVFAGCDLVTSLNPDTGELLWEYEGATTECVASTVTDGKHVFTSGGYPKNHIAAMLADGSGQVAWERNTRVYVPSMIARDGHLFAVLDDGIAMCIRCDDGKEIWKGRLGGTFSSSPVMVGDLVYATNEEGKTFVLKVSTSGFEQIAANQLGQSVFATPAICGSQIFTRVAHQENGQWQEYLYCIANQ